MGGSSEESHVQAVEGAVALLVLAQVEALVEEGACLEGEEDPSCLDG